MAWKYNPFTDALDKVSSGGGSYIDGEVEYHSNLPVTVGTPAVNSAFLVRKGEGLYFISRKPAGIWVRELNNGNLDDWKFAGLFSDLYRDANFRIINDTDVTKELKFDASAISTGTTRTITVPNKNVTLDDAGDSRTPTAHAASHASAGSDPLFDQNLNTTDVVQFASVTTPDIFGLGALEALGTGSNFTRVLGDGGLEFGGTNAASTRTNLGLAIGTDVAAASHVHGNITSDGKLGSTAGLPVVTTTAGAVTTLALGTANQVLRVNSGATGVEFADPAASGVTGAAASASDVLGVSGANITGVDANADRLVFWDDSANKMTYLEAGSGLSISGTTMTVTATGGATNLWIPASAWIPRTTGGCGVDSREIGATNRANVDELLFDTGTEEFAQALVVMPSNYNNSTITARFYWTAASGSGGVAWGISGRAYGDDDALDQASGTRIVVTDTFITANDVHVTSATSAVTIDGTPAANKAINFQISREVGNGSDTLGVDARLLGVEIIFN